MDETKLSQHSVAELKEMLRSKGLAVSGRKAELIARLSDSSPIQKQSNSQVLTSENTLSLAIFISAAVWGLYWIPLRAIENVGIPGSWTVPFFNACPLLVLIPMFILYFKYNLSTVN